MHQNKIFKRYISFIISFFMVFTTIFNTFLYSSITYGHEIKENKIIAGNSKIQKSELEIDKTDTTTPSAIKIVNKLEAVKVGNKINIELQDQDNKDIPKEELTFKVEDEKLGKMDEDELNKFIALSEGETSLTVTLKDNPNIKTHVNFNINENAREVYIRVEGYDHTIIPRTKIKVPLMNMPKLDDVEKYYNPTHAHAIEKVLLDNGFTIGKKGKGKFKFSTPFYLQNVDGDGEFDQGMYSGWMYRVNGKLPNVGASGKDLEDGDEIIWFYGAFGFLNAFTQISVDKTKVLEDQTIELTATGEKTDTNTYEIIHAPLDNATVVITKIVDGKEEIYNGLGEIKTDKNGKASLTFKEAGSYKLSLTRYGSDGSTEGQERIDIVRPIPVVVKVGSNDAKEKISSIKIDKTDSKIPEDCNIKVGDKVEFVVKDQNGGIVENEKLKFTVSDENEGKMDEKVNNRFITVVPVETKITVALKDNGEIKDTIDLHVKENIKKVNIRIEGYNKTLLKRTSQDVGLDDGLYYSITNWDWNYDTWGAGRFNNPTNIHAINKVFTSNSDFQNIKYKLIDNKGASLHITMIDGDEEGAHGEKSKWVYRVNDKLMKAPCNEVELNDGDDIVWYYAAIGDESIYTKLNVDKQKINVGERIKLTLDGYAGDVKKGLKDGVILVNEEEYKVNNESLKTDKDGNAEIIFNEPGEYVISTKAYHQDGIDIIKPVAINVKVNGEESLSGKINKSIRKTHNYIMENGTYSSDWKTVAFNKSGLNLPENYNKDYLKEKDDVLKESKGYFYKVTDYERITLGIVAAGGDPRNVGGYNLLDKIYNFYDKEHTERLLDFQGLNGIIYGLIALDTKGYDIAQNAKYTREYMLDYILNNRNGDGGWDLTMNGKKSDVDITAMTLISLAPYHNYISKDNKKASDAINEAVEWLSKVQMQDGGFNSWGTENNSESCAQTIIGLCANGVDPTSTKFTKDRNLVENLLRFQQDNGEFYHLMDGKTGINGMSTEQAYQALIAYKLFADMESKYCDGKNSIYYFGKDNIKTDDKDTKAPQIITTLKNGQEVYKEDLTFEVLVKDDVDKEVKPVVKVNDEIIIRTDGTYVVKLIQGDNVITIQAEDVAGNKADATYKITYIRDITKVNVEGIKLDKSSIELKEGETLKLTAIITPENASNKNVTWKCSDEKVAVVDKTGIVTAKSEGNAVIEVTTEDGDKKAQCNIKVIKKDTTTGGTPGGTPGGSGTTNPNTNNKEVTVYIRVEGYDHTIIPRTSVTTGVFDLNPYLGKATGSSATQSTGWGINKFTNPTHAHALVKLLEDNGLSKGSGYDLQDYGWSLYIAMIGGDREFDQGPVSGWMYSVNGALPPIGLNGKTLKEGDEVIWYYGADGFQTLVTTLKADKTSIKTGEKVSLSLNGFSTDGADGAGKVDHYKKTQLPAEKATILVNGKEYEVDGKIVKTDSNGQAYLQFNKPGKYEISAIRYSDSNGNKIDIVRPLPININVTGETINSNGSTGSTTGSSGGGSVGGSNTQLVVLASQQMSNTTIKNDELKIEIKGDREIVSVPESAILSKVDEVKKIIKDVLEKAKGDKEQLKKEIALIPIKIDDQKDNTILKIEASTLNKIKGENLGIKASFNGLEIKLPYNALPNLKGDEIIEIRKAEIKNMVQENIQMLKNNKVVSKTYSLTLYKVFKDGKEEKIKDLNDNAYVTIKIAPDQIKNISKTSLKINWYDKTNNKWVVLDSIYIPEQNIVVGKIK